MNGLALPEANSLGKQRETSAELFFFFFIFSESIIHSSNSENAPLNLK